MAGTGGGMLRWAGRVALVTGASSGIGQAMARSLDDVRSLSADNSATGFLHAIKCNLTKEEEILAMFAEIKEKFGGVDVCINNAGINHAGRFAASLGFLNGETEKWREILNVNFLATAICCREAVRQMEEKGAVNGQLILMISTSGHKVPPERGAHFYSATKFAIGALTEGIRQELREKKSHIRVAQISPGMVTTKFVERMYPNDPEEACQRYTTAEPMQVEDVANCVLYILQAPPHVQVHDILIRPTEQKV